MPERLELQDIAFVRGMAGHGLITAQVVGIKTVPDLAAGGFRVEKYIGKILTSSDPTYRPDGHQTLTCVFTPDFVLDSLKMSPAWRKP